MMPKPPHLPSLSHRPFRSLPSLMAWLLGLAGLFGVAPVRAVSLADVQALAKAAADSYPAVLAQKQLLESDQQTLQAAKLEQLPRLEVLSEKSDRSRLTSSTLAIEQVLWAGGRVWAQQAAAQGNLEARQEQIREVQTSIALRVVEAWQACQQAMGRLQEADLTVERLKRYTDMMQRRVEAQASAPIEMQLVAARLSQARVEQGQAQSGLESAKRRLMLLTGIAQLDVAPSASVATQPLFGELRQYIGMGSLEATLQALEVHPAVLLAHKRVEVLQQEARAVDATRLPTLVARVNVPIRKTFASQKTETVVAMRYDSTSGFASWARAGAAQAQVNGQILNAQTVLEDLRAEQQSDWQNWTELERRLPLLERAVQTSQAVVESYERQFIDNGRRNWLDVLNALRENADARNVLADTRVGLLSVGWRLKARAQAMEWQSQAPVVFDAKDSPVAWGEEGRTEAMVWAVVPQPVGAPRLNREWSLQLFAYPGPWPKGGVARSEPVAPTVNETLRRTGWMAPALTGLRPSLPVSSGI